MGIKNLHLFVMTSVLSVPDAEREQKSAAVLQDAVNQLDSMVVSVSAKSPLARDFELLKVIGMGAFGKVLHVRNKHSKRMLAMKANFQTILETQGWLH